MADIVEQLKRRLDARRERGLREYGVTVDGAAERDWLQEAIDEALDMAIYLERHRQSVEEVRRDG